MHEMSAYTFNVFKLSVRRCTLPPPFLYKSFKLFNLKYMSVDVKMVYGG
jgi:hypothetical protein